MSTSRENMDEQTTVGTLESPLEVIPLELLQATCDFLTRSQFKSLTHSAKFFVKNLSGYENLLADYKKSQPDVILDNLKKHFCHEKTYQMDSEICNAAVSGDWIAVLTTLGVEVFNLETGAMLWKKQLSQFKHPKKIWIIDEKIFCTAKSDKTSLDQIIILDLKTGNESKRISGSIDTDLVTVDRSAITARLDDGNIKQWNFLGNELPTTYPSMEQKDLLLQLISTKDFIVYQAGNLVEITHRENKKKFEVKADANICSLFVLDNLLICGLSIPITKPCCPDVIVIDMQQGGIKLRYKARDMFTAKSIFKSRKCFRSMQAENFGDILYVAANMSKIFMLHESGKLVAIDKEVVNGSFSFTELRNFSYVKDKDDKGDLGLLLKNNLIFAFGFDEKIENYCLGIWHAETLDKVAEISLHSRPYKIFWHENELGVICEQSIFTYNFKLSHQSEKRAEQTQKVDAKQASSNVQAKFR